MEVGEVCGLHHGVQRRVHVASALLMCTGRCGSLRTGVAFGSCMVDFKPVTYVAGSVVVSLT
jgi:hypothetical protein